MSAEESGVTAPPVILVDADACPVKDEIYRVAWRHEVAVKVVSNSFYCACPSMG